MKHETQKQPKHIIVRMHYYKCAYVTVKAVRIIFPVILQTVINLRMPSIGQGRGFFISRNR